MLFKKNGKIVTGICCAAAIAGVAAFGFFSGDDNDYFLKIYNGIDTFTRVYKDVAANYVDQINPELFMRAGIDGMLKTLDPYTSFIGEEEGDEIDLVTTGKYGGVGITIASRDGYVTVIGLIDGYSAARQGIEVGDRITGVDGKNVSGQSIDDVRLLVRGPQGTHLSLTIEREGEKAPLVYSLTREEIPVHNVSYAGFIEPGIAYVRLERFYRTTGNDMRSTLKDLKAKGDVKGFILDLRGNPGGLLEVAVDVVSQFVPDSTLIVSTRGRRADTEHKYFSSQTPMLPDVPVVVLVDRNSASASEIVAGAIQDMDRGIIVGTRTFGKGLVQTIERISETTALKITTARYYTPSGRCIQEIDYSHRAKDGRVAVIPDSVKKEFFTARYHRPVWDDGGIKPDSTVSDSEHIALIEELERKDLFFKYANHFAVVHKTLPDHFQVTKDITADFEKFTGEKGFTYEMEGEPQLKELQQAAAESGYSKAFSDEASKLSLLLKAEKSSQFQRHENEIRSALLTEILGRLKGEQAKMESTFDDDDQMQTALSLLKDKKVYAALLQGTR
jgi:carboxyl-terminal processing protease